MIAAGLHMVPNAVADLEQVLAASVGIVNTIPLTANLYPPKVVVLSVILMGQVGIGLVDVSPIGRGELDLMVGLTYLEKTAHSHRLFIGNVGGNALVEFRLCLSAVAVICTRKRSENRVARAVGKILCGYDVEGLGIKLPRLDGLNFVLLKKHQNTLKDVTTVSGYKRLKKRIYEIRNKQKNGMLSIPKKSF